MDTMEHEAAKVSSGDIRDLRDPVADSQNAVSLVTPMGAEPNNKLITARSQSSTMQAQLTLITVTKPKRLSKAFKLDSKGLLTKIQGGQLVEGEARKIAIVGPREMASLLETMTPGQALIYGITDHDLTRVVTQDALGSSLRNAERPVVSRTRKYFRWPDGAGILMFDYDPREGCEPLSADGFRSSIYAICPEIEGAPHVVAASASSFIFNDEIVLRGAAGWRMLVIVEDGRGIPRAGAAFFARCWLNGQGYIGVSKAGSLLERALVDASVWQPERLDFCGGAHCFPPLKQKRPKPQFFNPDADPLDTRTSLRSLTLQEEAQKKRIVLKARKIAEPAAEKKREIWLQSRISDALEGVPEAERGGLENALHEVYTQAVKTQVLLSGFVLQPESGGTVSVGEILDDPEKWHGKRFADPLEPEYHLDSRIAVANLHAAGRPYIYSHAHGGRRFTLHRARETILIVKGQRVAVVERALELMRLNGRHFVRGGEIVLMSSDGEVYPRDAQGLCFDLDGMVRFETINARGELVSLDCPSSVAIGVSVNQEGWRLPILDGVATAPLIEPHTGRIIDRDGYDPETRIMLILNDLSRWSGIPENPGVLDVDDAINTLWTPFENFPFVGPVDRGVMLAAILTAVIRPLLKTAPAFAFDAPVPASGKTLLARCLSELAGDSPPTVFPIAEKEDEIRKRLLAILRSNRRIVVVDNAIREVESAALCAFLTNEVYGDRLLGESLDLRFPTRALFIFTGNNLALRGDLCRRVLTARIDPKMEQPWTRCFDLDPAQYCRENRLEMVAAALTILRAGIQKGPGLPERTGSFEVWSDTVRRAVMFCKEHRVMDLEDPVQSINVALAGDSTTQNLKGLLAAWYAEWGSARLTVSELLKTAARKADREDDADGTLISILKEIAPARGGGVNNRSLGRWLDQNRDRIMDQLFLCSAGKGHAGGRAWQVRSVNEEKSGGGQQEMNFQR
jgi:hypothetical protein